MQDKSLPNPQGENFASWLSALTTSYKALSNEKRNILLKQLISNSEPHQLNFLSTHVPALSCRDFFTYLPLELVAVIAQHLSGKQLLLLRQVCKSWKDRINSLKDVWQIKASAVGVDVQSIASKHLGHMDRAGLYKGSYILAEQFLSSLKRGKISLKSVQSNELSQSEDVDTESYLGPDSAAFADRISGDATIFSIPDWKERAIIRTGQRVDTVILVKNGHLFTSNFTGRVDSFHIDSFLVREEEDDDDESDEEENDANGNPKKHTYIGHTSSVEALDTTEIGNTTYVISGSKDKTVKIWIIHRATVAAELFMTLENSHTKPVSEVFFLLCDQDQKLKFISCGISQELYLWSLNVSTRRVQSARMELEADIPSFHFDITKPEDVYITEWNFYEKYSVLRSYKLCYNDNNGPNEQRELGIEHGQRWDISKHGFKACVLGVGKRFALLICGVSVQDFMLLDLITGSNMAMFTTRKRFQTLHVKLYDSSWLDGFTFEKKEDRWPTLAGSACVSSFSYCFELSTFKLDFPVLSVRDTCDMEVE